MKKRSPGGCGCCGGCTFHDVELTQVLDKQYESSFTIPNDSTFSLAQWLPSGYFDDVSNRLKLDLLYNSNTQSQISVEFFAKRWDGTAPPPQILFDAGSIDPDALLANQGGTGNSYYDARQQFGFDFFPGDTFTADASNAWAEAGDFIVINKTGVNPANITQSDIDVIQRWEYWRIRSSGTFGDVRHFEVIIPRYRPESTPAEEDALHSWGAPALAEFNVRDEVIEMFSGTREESDDSLTTAQWFPHYVTDNAPYKVRLTYLTSDPDPGSGRFLWNKTHHVKDGTNSDCPVAGPCQDVVPYHHPEFEVKTATLSPLTVFPLKTTGHAGCTTIQAFMQGSDWATQTVEDLVVSPGHIQQQYRRLFSSVMYYPQGSHFYDRPSTLFGIEADVFAAYGTGGIPYLYEERSNIIIGEPDDDPAIQGCASDGLGNIPWTVNCWRDGISGGSVVLTEDDLATPTFGTVSNGSQAPPAEFANPWEANWDDWNFELKEARVSNQQWDFASYDFDSKFALLCTIEVQEVSGDDTKLDVNVTALVTFPTWNESGGGFGSSGWDRSNPSEYTKTILTTIEWPTGTAFASCAQAYDGSTVPDPTFIWNTPINNNAIVHPDLGTVSLAETGDYQVQDWGQAVGAVCGSGSSGVVIPQLAQYIENRNRWFSSINTAEVQCNDADGVVRDRHHVWYTPGDAWNTLWVASNAYEFIEVFGGRVDIFDCGSPFNLATFEYSWSHRVDRWEGQLMPLISMTAGDSDSILPSTPYGTRWALTELAFEEYDDGSSSVEPVAWDGNGGFTVKVRRTQVSMDTFTLQIGPKS